MFRYRYSHYLQFHSVFFPNYISLKCNLTWLMVKFLFSLRFNKIYSRISVQNSKTDSHICTCLHSPSFILKILIYSVRMQQIIAQNQYENSRIRMDFQLSAGSYDDDGRHDKCRYKPRTEKRNTQYKRQRRHW